MTEPGAAPAATGKLYAELAHWWPLLSDPADYAEEAAFFHQVLSGASTPPPVTLLELGSGGGSNASHMKAHYQLTLVDLSPGMLAVSQALNPECEHLQGDMRTVRLGRLFDAVFIHDAIEYMTTVEALRQALETAFVHCRPGGVALFVPDHVRETFEPSTSHGGHDGQDRALRYLEWTLDIDPSATSYVVDYVYMLRDSDGSLQVESDRHHLGLHPREVWLGLLREIGFTTTTILIDDYDRELFVALRPA